MSKVHVVIVGAGFGGLNAAKNLVAQDDVSITLIDRRNHHLFQPLLYQVATAGLSPAEIACPIRSILGRRPNVEVLLGEVTDVNIQTKKITTEFGTLEYDYLILACGSEQSYFGHDEWKEIAPGLKSVEDAIEIRRRILLAFELAEREFDDQKRRKLLNFIIVGGGPTGVELAGAIAEIACYSIAKDFKRISPKSARIILVEAGSRILSSFTEDLSTQAAKDLRSLGVEVKANSKVELITQDGAQVNGEWIDAGTVVWAAGVKPSALNAKLGVALDRQGRIIVANDCSIPGHPEVFVIGDQAHFDWRQAPLPGLAPVALQQGQFVARAIRRDIRKKPRMDFRYIDKGQMATIGRTKAVLQFGRFKMSGLLAWLAWLIVHVYYLIGFRNRFFVIWEWAYAYITFKRGARLITNQRSRSEFKTGM